MEILTEFDELQAALAKINMDESVLPYINGRLVDDEAFNKSQKILNCPEMISAHKYIYELDMDQLTEEDTDKINQLYDLGVKRGFIIDDLTKWDDGNEEEETVAVEEVPETPAQPQNTLFKAKVPCWTVIYSATKDGSIKTGEAYSNAVSMSAAKADVNAKLSQCGYDNITILAIENCTDAPQPFAAPTAEIDVNEADDEEKAEDDDASDEETSDEGSDEDESGNEEVSDEESNDEEESDEEASDGETSDEETSDEESDEETSDEEPEDDASDDEETSDDEDSNEEDSDEEDSDEEELDAGKKSELRNMYRQTFKNTLVKCKFDTSFNDLTLEQKVKFFTELSKAWNEEYDPKDFMTDKELEQLDNVVADVDTGSNEDSDKDSDEDAGNDKESDEENSDEE